MNYYIDQLHACMHTHAPSAGSRPARGAPDGAAGDGHLRRAAVGEGGGGGAGPRAAGDAPLRLGGRLLRRGGAALPLLRRAGLHGRHVPRHRQARLPRGLRQAGKRSTCLPKSPLCMNR